MAVKTPISILQELMMKTNQGLPIYSFGDSRDGQFSCIVKTASVTGTGLATNKKDAKQLAAENALIQLGFDDLIHKMKSNTCTNSVSHGETLEQSPNCYIPGNNYIGKLNEYASGRGLRYPIYEEPFFPEEGQYKSICKFQGLETEGYALKKKEAKQKASYKMILNLNIIESTTSTAPAIPFKKTTIEFDEIDHQVIRKFETITLSTHCEQKEPSRVDPVTHIKKKKYTLEECEDELLRLNVKYEIQDIQSHPYIVVVTCNNKDNMTVFGSGSTRKEALHKALNSSLEILRGGRSLVLF
ncbi:hypothetical protein HHI36_010576 [Cryptolaemus montrouzieri]|uniref:DRBM domain-containing protein n=1 Tax=Cryptolaemus montrouzieri TaxID=559131 RepID=A0ABD2MJ87_9CUCU